MGRDRLEATPHRRFNPLIREWVLVSPQRAERPWQGQVEKNAIPKAASYDPSCYLCPGNQRAGSMRNPAYTSTFVFRNDFAALQPDGPHVKIDESERGLLLSESESGICEVVCFSPRHDLTLSRMSLEEIAAVAEVWAHEYAELGSLSYVKYVQVFENRGEIMGCSNPHPHGQIWANETIPNEPSKEQDAQIAYAEKNKSCLLCDYARLELKAGKRVVCENPHFLALVPYWAIWPFEILLISKNHVRDLMSLNAVARLSLVDILKGITTRYANLFETSFPYSMGIHQAPTDGGAHPEWHCHAHFYPPLLRSATVRKFMVGYEMLATPQRDITPELAASKLSESSEVHYLDRK